jgi:hypothetical protein
MGLNEELSKLEIKREIKEEVEKVQLKKRLSLWADSIPHHGLANFGEQIELLAIKSVPTYVVTLKVQYEIRSLREGTWPYWGNSIFPDSVKLNNGSKIWSLNLPLVDDFSEIVKQYSVSGTERISTCNVCSGSGKVTCHRCGGGGELRCHECGGSARITCRTCNGSRVENCSNCGGRGSTQGNSDVNYREITCPSCGGNKRSICPGCGGHGTNLCPVCTNGKVVCDTCSGSGKVTCNQCKGAGKEISCFYLRDRFISSDGLNSIYHDSVPTEIRTKITHSRRTGESIVKLLDQEIKKDVFSSLNHEFLKRACDNLLDQAKDIKGYGAHYLRKYRTLKEALEIVKVKVFSIEYKFSGKTYQAWLYGEDEFWTPASPISDICEKWFSDAQKVFKKKEYSAALDWQIKL